MKVNFVIAILLVSSFAFAQRINIVPQLKKIEAGEIEEVKRDLAELKINNSADANVIFLEAVITEDGEQSQKFYELIYNNFPNTQFADAALFRGFSYYYALGLYKRAGELKDRLIKEYPKSPYLKNTDRSFPDVDEMIIVDSTPYKLKNKNNDLYTVQAGAFSNYNNAEMLKRRFLEDGLKSKILPKRVNNLQLHIVTVGSFGTKADANTFLNALQRDYAIKGRVISKD